MTKSKFTNDWVNTKIEKLCKQQRKAFNKAKKTGKQEHKDKYKKNKATTQREISRAQSNYQ
jgi:adenylate kinase